MKIIDIYVTHLISGGYAAYSDGFYTVTGTSTFQNGDLILLAHQVKEKDGNVLYQGEPGSVGSFCYKDTLFIAAPEKDGHSYIPWSPCSLK